MDTRKIIIYIISSGVIFFLLTFFVSAILIGSDVENRCKIVQRIYEGDCVEALMKLIENETVGYGEKK